LLSKLVQDVSSHLESSEELINKLLSLNRSQLLRHAYPFSLDVVALYTSVPVQDAIRTTVRRLNEKNFHYHGLRPYHIKQLLQTVLQRRIFTFNNKLYEQTNGLAMGSRLSGILATLVMDDLERQTLTSDLRIGLYARYVDDTFILTENLLAAEEIYNKMNNAHNSLKFEMEKPVDGHSISILDFNVKICNGEAEMKFYRKSARKNMFPHNRSALPENQKKSIIINELKRIQNRCSKNEEKEASKNNFIAELKERGYNETLINRCILQSNNTRQPQTRREIEHWLYFPFINSKYEKKVKKSLRKSGFPIGIWRKETNIRMYLSKVKGNESCPGNCGIINCQTQNVVYKYTCGCGAEYIGSTKRKLHVRANEHLSPAPSQTKTAIKLHEETCGHTSGSNIKIHDRGRDSIETRIKEAVHIERTKPRLNERKPIADWMEQT